MKIFKRNVDSKSELIESMHKCGTEYVLLGQDSEVVNGSYIFQIETDNEMRFTVGVLTEGHGLEPMCKCIKDKIFIGFNHELHIIDISNKEDKIIYSNSLFYEFSLDAISNRIIVVFELEIICISVNGNIYWRYMTDIINDYSIENNYVNVTTDSGKEVIDLLTGKLMIGTFL